MIALKVLPVRFVMRGPFTMDLRVLGQRNSARSVWPVDAWLPTSSLAAHRLEVSAAARRRRTRRA